MIKYKAHTKLTLARVDNQLTDVNFNFVIKNKTPKEIGTMKKSAKPA
jgi:hypothetical protein